MSIERHTGLSWWDVGLHVFITICLIVPMVEANPVDEDMIIPLGFAASAVVFAIRRRFALRRRPRGTATGEVEALRVEDLEARLAELEAAHQRVYELEERLDFAERLLAQQRADSDGRVLARPESG